MDHVLSACVGLMFFVSGMSKAVHSGPFLSHLQQLGWLPPAITPIVCVAMTGGELALATALLLHVYPVVTIPIGLMLLVLVSAVTWVGYRQGAIEHCGCYGRWLPLTPKQSLALNGVLGLILGAAMLLIPEETLGVADIRPVLLAMALGMFMAGRSAEDPLLDLAPTRVGETWQEHWIEGLSLPDRVPGLIAFVNPKCKLCMSWTQPLKRMSDRHQWPLHVVVSESQIEKARELLMPGFVLHAVPAKKLVWLVDTVPSVLQVQGGTIEARWTGRVPRAWKPKTGGSSQNVAA